jgi:hypothetical protein
VTTVGNFLAQVTWALACCLPFCYASSFNRGERRRPTSCKLMCWGIIKLFCGLGSGAAEGPKSSHILAIASSVGASRRAFDFELAAASEDEDTSADVHLFPPSETCVTSEIEERDESGRGETGRTVRCSGARGVVCWLRLCNNDERISDAAASCRHRYLIRHLVG